MDNQAIEVEKIQNYARPLIKGMNKFYWVKEGEEFIVMQRFLTREPKPYKTFKTMRGAINRAYHMNIN